MSFAFADRTSLNSLLDRLRANHGWGQIVGPHGVGKSTLLASLVPALREEGREVVLVELRDKQRRLPKERSPAPMSPVTLIVDGYEQLSWWQRWRLMRSCRRANCGLIVTTHTDAGLPMLASLTPDLPTVQKLVQRLGENVPSAASGVVTGVITEADVAASYRAHDGNVREIFFDLYDRYDRSVRQSRTSAALNS